MTKWLDVEPDIGYNILSNLWSDSKGEPLAKHGKYQVYDIQNIDGWEIHEMESGEYPDHDAIFIDRKNKRMVINYQGHHSPMFEQYPELMNEGSYDSTAGHFRSRPSTTEPFPAGWGWHGGQATPDEKTVLKKALKQHYQVKALQDLYQEDPDAEENWLDLEPEEDEQEQQELPGGGTPPPKFTFTTHKIAAYKRESSVEWLDNNTKALTWKGLYDILNDRLILWSTDAPGAPGAPHHIEMIERGEDFLPAPVWDNSVHLMGHYTKPDFRATHTGDNVYDPAEATDRAYQLLIPALQQRWPVKESNFSVAARWMIDDNGNVIIGNYPDHYSLIWDEHTAAAAEQYKRWDFTQNEVYPFTTGGYIKNAIIYIVRSAGEPEFDPIEVGRAVMAKAESEGIAVDGTAIYEDSENNITDEIDLRGKKA